VRVHQISRVLKVTHPSMSGSGRVRLPRIVKSHKKLRWYGKYFPMRYALVRPPNTCWSEVRRTDPEYDLEYDLEYDPSTTRATGLTSWSTEEV
jgi:hypothetical protein